jgi:hypothetical protein
MFVLWTSRPYVAILPIKKLGVVQGVRDPPEPTKFSHPPSSISVYATSTANYPTFFVKVKSTRGHLLALVDSGSTCNFVHPLALPDLHYEFLKDDSVFITLADGSSNTYDVKQFQIAIKLLDVDLEKSQHSFISWNNLKYDLILGLPWLQKANPNIEWTTLSVTKTVVVGSAAIDLNSLPEEYHSFAHVFDTPTDTACLPPSRPFDLGIELKSDILPKTRPIYPLAKKEETVLKNYLEEWLKVGIARPSTSPIASPIFFVPKKDGDLRPFVDYRDLNSITIVNRYPLQLIASLLHRPAKAQFFTVLDLHGAYNLLRIKKGHEWKTAFRC